MNWSFSLKLQPGEEVLEKSQEARSFALAGMYAPVLTNRRAIFRLNSLTTNLVQSFPYEEITAVQPATRMLVQYLKVTARGRDHFFNVDEPEEWARKIMESKESFAGGAASARARRQGPSLTELLGMLDTLREYGLLTEDEFTEKRKKIIA